ncbi:MAG: TolC family protein [Desulfobaccales bacterium]
MTDTRTANFRGTEYRPGRSLQPGIVSAALLLAIILALAVTASRAQERTQVISIEDAYRMALQSHELILISEKEIDKSKLGTKKALAMMLPHADLSGTYQTVDKAITQSNILNVINILPKDQTMGDIKVTNSIYNPNYFPARRQANETIDKTTNNCYQVIQDVLLQVGKEYYLVLRANELVQNSKGLIQTAQEAVRESKVKFAAGAVTEDVLLGSLMDLATMENKLISDSNRLRLAKDDLRNLISLKTANFEVAKPAHLTEPNQSYETLLGSAYDHRFDHKMSISDVELAKSGVEVVKAHFQPSLDVSWEYYSVHHPRYDQDANNWAAVASVTFPFLEGGLRVWELREAKETLEQAKLSLADKRRSIRMEVDSAMLTVYNNKSLLLKMQSQIDLAQKNYEIVFSKFKHGAATIVDLSQALSALGSAKTDLINKTYDYQTSLLDLQKATGIFVLDFITGLRLQGNSIAPAINNKR